MTTVGSYEAKTYLPALLDRVERGETILITRKGKPAAKLVPLEDNPFLSDDAFEAFKEFRKKNFGKLRGLDIKKDLIEYGRR